MIRGLMELLALCLCAPLSFSVSHTTRAPRPGEVDGVDYVFSSKDSMEASIQAGEFIEYAQVHGNYYGTSRQGVQAVTAKGQGCVLDIDVQGASQVRASGMEAVTIFVRPPGKEVECRSRRGEWVGGKRSVTQWNAIGWLGWTGIGARVSASRTRHRIRGVDSETIAQRHDGNGSGQGGQGTVRCHDHQRQSRGGGRAAPAWLGHLAARLALYAKHDTRQPARSVLFSPADCLL